MNSLRIITVDDERLALRRLKLLLQSIPFAEHIQEANCCAEAIAAIDALSPDVILLDIAMRDGDGFDVIEALSQRPNPPVVIFVTAATAEQRLGEMAEIVRNLRAHTGGHNGTPYDTEFWLRGAGGLLRVPVELIDCVSSEDDYVAVHTPRGSHLMRGSIRQFEGRVEPGQFVRVHRGWLVRRAAINELRTSRFTGSEILLRSGKRVPVGRVYLKLLKAGLREKSSQF